VFRTSEQVSSLLQADCIALVPLWTSKEASHASDNQSASPGWNDSETILPDQNKSRAIANSLFSKLAEAFRSFTLVSDMRGTIKSTKLNVTSFATSLSAERSPVIDSLQAPKTLSQIAGPRTIVRSDNPVWAVVDAPFRVLQRQSVLLS